MAHLFDLVIRGGVVADGTGGDLREADVGVRAGRITEVAPSIAGRGADEIDARGLLVTPGFIDVHTHYDGQLTWSDRLSPSSSHGVTTVVSGNCGVGFAPCRGEDQETLVRLMEGIEDIPEVVMSQGLPWDWRTFPEFLDAVERKPHDIDFAVLLPHSPLRVFVMGQRAVDLEPATPADQALMRQLTCEAMRAGAVGVGTSRSIHHKASDGRFSPSMAAAASELRAIASGMADARRGLLQAVASTEHPHVDDYELLHAVAADTGRPLTYTLLDHDETPDLSLEVLAAVDRVNAKGRCVRPQVFNRPVGVILGLETGHHPFAGHPYFRENLAPLSHEQRVARMRTPQVRSALLADAARAGKPMRPYDKMFPLSEPVRYDLPPSASIAALAAAHGQAPEAVAFDLLIEREGTGKLLMAPVNRNFDRTYELMRHPDTVLGLGDGGAHCGLICDATYTTFGLTYWVRDRLAGPRLGLAEMVRKLTSDPASLYGFTDRGRVARGMKADLNVIDIDRLSLHAPSVVYDLPGGGRRLLQTATGYVATIVAGQIIQREGADTGARPGCLVRDAGRPTRRPRRDAKR